jgi:DNA topoisomerase-2
MDFYKKRKEYLEGMLGAESLKLDNIARFIVEKIEGKIKVENLKKTEICRILRERGYNADPVLKWKEKITRERGYENEAANAAAAQAELDSEAGVAEEPKSMKDFDYILGMPIWNLTMEKKDDILKQQRTKADELGLLKAKTVSELWLDDLAEFTRELDKYEAKEREDENATQLKTFKAAGREQGKKGANFAAGSSKRMEYMPAADGVKVEPVVDPALISKTEKEAKSKEKRDKEKEESTEIKLVDVIVGTSKLTESQIAEFVKNMDKKPVAVKKEAKEPGAKKSPKAKRPAGSIKSEKLDADENTNSNTATISSDDESSSAAPSVKKSPAKVKREPKEAKPVKTTKAETAKSSITDFFKKKTTKKGALSSSEDEADVTIEEEDVSFVDDTPVEPRKIARARKEVKYAQFLGSDSEDTRETKNSAVKDESDDDVKLDSDDDCEVVAKSKKKASAPAAAPPSKKVKKTVASDSDESVNEVDDEDDDFGFSKKSKAAAKKEPEKPKPVVNAFAKMKEAASKPKRAIESDDENKPPGKKTSAAENTKKPAEAKKTATSSSSNLLKPSNSIKKPSDEKPKKAAAAAPKKSKYAESDDESEGAFICEDEENSDEEFALKKKPAKKKLLEKPSDFDIFGGGKRNAASAPKKPRNVIEEDNDLFAIDSE